MPVSIPTTDAFFAKKYPLESLKKMLIPVGQWKPYPTAADRPAWDALPDSLRRVQIGYGEQALVREWPHLQATNYLKFARVGNRDQYEVLNFARRDILGTLVVAECIEGQGRFLDAITNAVWSICEESTWVLPAHQYAQRAGSGLPDTSEPVVDLFAAETAALVAWTVYLVGEQLQTVSPQIVPRLQSRNPDAHFDPQPGTGRLLVDGVWRAPGKQLEPVDQFQLADLCPAHRRGRRPPHGGGS